MNDPVTLCLHLSISLFPLPPLHLSLSFLFVLSVSLCPGVAGLEQGVVTVGTQADCQGGKQHASEIKTYSKTNRLRRGFREHSDCK